jgi:glycine/D-amino acid oxidase-like deaminating enzyme
VVGLAATAALRARGVDVTCYERAGAVMAERSAGSSRILRLAHASPELVELARRARAAFRAWEERSGTVIVGAQECIVSGPDLPARVAAMTVRSSGRMLAISGGNLFKFVPLLGEVLAEACLDGSTPTVAELAR